MRSLRWLEFVCLALVAIMLASTINWVTVAAGFAQSTELGEAERAISNARHYAIASTVAFGVAVALRLIRSNSSEREPKWLSGPEAS